MGLPDVVRTESGAYDAPTIVHRCEGPDGASDAGEASAVNLWLHTCKR
jgi:hypothetical protein